jgi:predicted membrane protein
MDMRKLILLAVGVIIALVVIQFVLVAFFGFSLGLGFSFLAFGAEHTRDALIVMGLMVAGALVLFFRPFPVMWNWVAAVAAFGVAAVVWMGWL